MKTKNKKILIAAMAIILILAIVSTGMTDCVVERAETSYRMTAFAVDEPEVSPLPTTSPPEGEGLVENILNDIKEFFFTILGNIALFILWLVDSMFALIGILIGSGVVEGEKSILEMLLAEDGIKKALFGITALGSVLVLFVGAFAVFRRSTSDKHGEVGTVVKNMLKAVALFIAVPLLSLAIIFIVNLLVQGINLAINNGAVMSSFGSKIFDAGFPTTDNFINGGSYFKTQMPIPVYNIESLKIALAGLDDVIFNVAEVDWLIILVGGIALLWFCFPTIIMLVSRLFEVVILYLFDAIPIAFMPYDDGERFNHWKDEFAEKFMSAYGVVISYSLFGMLMPTITDMTFIQGNSFFRIIIILGGAYFMNKAPQLINGLLGLKGSGIGDMLGGIGLRQSIGAGIKGTVGAAIGAGALAARKTKTLGRLPPNTTVPSTGSRTERILKEREKLQSRGEKLEAKRSKTERNGESSGRTQGNNATLNPRRAKSVEATPVVATAKSGFIPWPSKSRQNVERKNAIVNPPNKRANRINSKIQKNNAKLSKNNVKIAKLRKEVSRNALLGGDDYKRNWEQARKRREGK